MYQLGESFCSAHQSNERGLDEMTCRVPLCSLASVLKHPRNVTLRPFVSTMSSQAWIPQVLPGRALLCTWARLVASLLHPSGSLLLSWPKLQPLELACIAYNGNILDGRALNKMEALTKVEACCSCLEKSNW